MKIVDRSDNRPGTWVVRGFLVLGVLYWAVESWLAFRTLTLVDSQQRYLEGLADSLTLFGPLTLLVGAAALILAYRSFPPIFWDGPPAMGDAVGAAVFMSISALAIAAIAFAIPFVIVRLVRKNRSEQEVSESRTIDELAELGLR